MSWQRTEWFGVAAFGTDGGQPLLDGSAMEAGVHLRWSMRNWLGFPEGGFDVYRRAADDSNPVCVDFTGFIPSGNPFTWEDLTFSTPGGPFRRDGMACTSGALFLPGAAHLRVRLPATARKVTLSFPLLSDPPTGRALWRLGEELVLVDKQSAASTTTHLVITLQSDAIDEVVVVGTDLRLCEICVTYVPSDLTTGWTLLTANPINLPVTDTAWAGTHPNAPDDQAEAEARLPAALSSSVFDRYADGFGDLREILVSLVEATSQEDATQGGEGSGGNPRRTPPDLLVPTLDLLRIMALDPNIARILGLYYVDTTAVTGVAYDYRVVGHWGSRDWPATEIALGDVPVSEAGTPVRHGLLLLTSPKLIVPDEITFLAAIVSALCVQYSSLSAGPVVIRLTGTWKQVQLDVAASTTLIVDALESGSVVDTVTVAAGDRQPRLESAGGIRSIRVRSAGTFWLVKLTLFRDTGTVGDLNYVTFNRVADTPAAVDPLELVSAEAAAGSYGIDDASGAVTGTTNAVALRWREADSTNRFAIARSVFVLVERDDLGSGSSPGAVASTTTVNADTPTLYSRGEAVTPRPSGVPASRSSYIDRDLADGWYGYRVRAVDLFGRLLDASTTSNVEVRNAASPPPPDAVSAQYLYATDRWLHPDDQAWTATNGSGLKVTWTWTGRQRIQAPQVEGAGEFRIYWQPDRFNVLIGSVTSVTSASGTSTLFTDIQVTAAADALVGQLIRVNRTWFEIVGNTSGANAQIVVTDLTSPAESPSPGEAIVPLNSTSAGASDYANRLSWAMRLAVESAVAIPAPTGTIVSVSGSGETRTVTTGESLAGVADGLVAGVLVTDGVVFPVTAHTDTGTLVLTVQVLVRGDDTVVEPSATHGYTYYPGMTYTRYVAGVSLIPGDTERVGVANVAVSTSDNQSHVADDSEWSDTGRGGLGGRAGNEGPLSRAARVVNPRRTTPDTPTVTTTGLDYAEECDFYGVSRYTVRWTAPSSAASIVGYNVYRTTTARVFAADLERRRAGTAPYTSGRFDDDDGFEDWLAENHPWLTEADFTDSTAIDILDGWRGWARHFYPSLDASAIQQLANDDTRTFARVNAEPIDDVEFLDSFPGRGSATYLYRVASVDSSGNESVWSDTLTPVALVDVTPPAAPIVLSCVSGENEITLTWRASSESDVGSYRIFRATSAAALEDVRPGRGAELLATQTATAGASVETYTDTGLEAGVVRYYRIAAVDTNDNQSAPSATVYALATDATPPDGPSFTRVEWILLDGEDEYPWGDPGAPGTAVPAVALQWTAGEAGLTCTLERKGETGGWENMETAMEADDPSDPEAEEAITFTTRDSTADSATDYLYRVRAYDAAGNFNVAHSVAALDAAE